MLDKISYEVVEHLAVLSVTPKGWRKEINLVSWNDRPPKFDIREWSPDHTKMSKGLTFTNDELSELKKALAEIEL